MSNRRKILFVTSTRIGDAVLSTGLLKHISEKYPDAAITVACGPAAAGIFKNAPRLERLITIEKRRRNLHWLVFWRECAGTVWDMVVDLRNSAAASLLPRKGFVKRPSFNTGRHKILDLADALELNPPPSPFIWLSEDDLRKAKEIVPEGNPFVAMAPTANWPAKQWPMENFAKLAEKFLSSESFLPNAKILVATSPQEARQTEILKNNLPKDRLVFLAGEDLTTVAACIKRCAVFVGNDSGLMHLAAAVGTPTLGLFGPGYEKIYGPWGEKCAVARTPESAEELLAKKRAPDESLMRGLGVDSVYEAMLRVIGLFVNLR